jgi:leader peptidase (prepilin peptidase)/N-methyltransferase
VSLDLAAALLGLLLCGNAGLLVPALIARIPEHDPPAYGAVAARPHLAVVSALVAGISGALVGAVTGLDWPLLLLLPLVPVSVALAVVDWHTHLLPTAVVRPVQIGIVLLGTASALLDDDVAALGRAAIGGVVVLAFFHALWWVHAAGMGYGDVRLAAVLGFALGYVGWAALVIGIYGAFLAFGLGGLAVALVRWDRSRLKVAYPFGPFLLAGALVGVVVGQPLWSHLATR